jgi:hypothetical protein
MCYSHSSRHVGTNAYRRLCRQDVQFDWVEVRVDLQAGEPAEQREDRSSE